jgi:hypothetical protein
MSLGEFLPLLGEVAGVPLSAGAEPAPQKVSVFAEKLPAGRVLDALTAMLNMPPEGGYSWEAVRGRRGFRLIRSVRAQTEARARLAAEEQEMADRFRAELRQAAHDPEQRRLALDPEPDPQFRRGSHLVSLLTGAQLDRLLRDGFLVLRAGEVPKDQARLLSLLGQDLRKNVEQELAKDPNSEFLQRMIRDLNPADFAFSCEIRQRGLGLTLTGSFSPGPNRGAASVWVFPPGEGYGLDPAEPPSERTDEPPLRLRPANWWMGDVLTEIARRSRLPLVSDCYALSWYRLQSSSTAPLSALLSRLERSWQFRSERRDGFLLLRARDAALRQAEEVAPELLDRWMAQIEREGGASLDLLDEMTRLDRTQVEGLHDLPAMRTRAGEAAWMALYMAANFLRPAVRLFASLTPEQQSQIRAGGVRLRFAEMTGEQRESFVRWMIQREPFRPEAAFDGATMTLRVTPERVLEVTTEIQGEQKTRRHFLELTRVDFNGEPLPARAEASALLDRAAPRIEVTTLEGKKMTLAPPPGTPFAVLFHDLWSVPYIGRGPDDADLKSLAGFLGRRPELTGRTAVIIPDIEPEELRAWGAASGLELPLYAEPAGRTAHAFGCGTRSTAVRINAGGRVRAVLEGSPDASKAPWDTWLAGG